MLGLGLGWDVDPVQAMLIGMGLLFVGIGPLLPRISSNRWTGIRTPWTLSNETVWRRTHRIGGYTVRVRRVSWSPPTAFLPHPARLWVSALAFLAMVMIPVVVLLLHLAGAGRGLIPTGSVRPARHGTSAATEAETVSMMRHSCSIGIDDVIALNADP